MYGQATAARRGSTPCSRRRRSISTVRRPWPRPWWATRRSIGRVKVRSRTRSAAPCSRSEEHTSELQSRFDLVCRLLLEKKNNFLLHVFFCFKTKQKQK